MADNLCHRTTERGSVLDNIIKEMNVEENRGREDEDDDMILFLVTQNNMQQHFTASNTMNLLLLRQQVLGNSAKFEYFKDPERWHSVVDFRWLSEFTERYHFHAFFRFYPEQILELARVLSLPERLDYTHTNRVPGIIGFCILLMR
jgi:hypothetical protein